MKDKRTEKTLNLIRSSYLKLSRVKPVHKITVKDICDDANINRGTFYRYYCDVPELKDHLEEEAAKRFVSAIVSEYQFDAYSDSCRDNLFQALKDYPDDTYLLFPCSDTYGTSRTKDILYEMLKAKSLPEWIKKSSISEAEAEVVFYYTVQSMLNLLKLWSTGGTPMQESEFKALYSKLIRTGIHSVVYTKVKRDV